MTEKELQQYLLATYPREDGACEWKEMKNLKNSFAGDVHKDVISYVSAIANMRGGHLVIGVKDKTLEIVGTDLAAVTFNGAPATPESATFKLVELCAYLPSEGLGIEEFVTEDTRKTVWVVHIPRHSPRKPVLAHREAWQRIGDSLVKMTQERLDAILCEPMAGQDWSAQAVPDATLADLDVEAINLAREGYKQRFPHLAKECDAWSDSIFLDKAGLTTGGRVTRTTLLLVGKAESAHKLNHIAQIVWKCFQDGQVFGDIYTIPFIRTTTEVLRRIRNYRLKIYPKDSLIPAEVWKYDTESILEGMHNSIAHQNYERGARIIVTECKDSLRFQNDGNFFEGDYTQYIAGEKTPKSYRNPALVKAMVNTKMIDTQGYGIHKMFQSQKDRFLPMPDYDQSTDEEVILNMPGTIISEDYSLMLLANQSLSLADAVLLDRVQKGLPIPADAVARLRSHKLIEGRSPHIYVSKNVAQMTGKRIEYSKHKGITEKKCVALLLESLRDHGSLTKREIVELLWDILPDQLEDRQKENKIDNMLRKLRESGDIVNETAGSNSRWLLADGD